MRSPAPVLLGALALSATTAVAQIPPPCNTYPILLVDSTGVAAPTTGSGLQAVASIAVEEVYMSFANLPDGTHRLYVHVTDRLDGITDEVLSTNDPADRFVDVAKTNGVVDISLPFTNNQDPNIIVTLPNGNEILRITPVRNALTEPCLFKAWMGNTYSLNMRATPTSCARTPTIRAASPPTTTSAWVTACRAATSTARRSKTSTAMACSTPAKARSRTGRCAS
jgi:hypothetical protein